ncbi:DUF2919 domain-containing protein [Shewanella colwelliana]|uniref:DUF2919 domain-containing protein n=1 Tax=Shewanella colwelliana TaxID=23 RepID=A0A1E5IXR5_SHECO|nr:DUF2919 domain-containing protein [Shewanella colwelliana]MCZ4338813.1 DUF2919 domain-containing protein [Shewanella colwelliana]MDX1282103.1 DUF2919 domain-containing protein [Shewanella colwelliana]OEG75345.1 hypothetical protein BEL05_09070 [Shewanella colwelliana]GIU28027.1 hypothetical protein TUM4644_25390 [Shewanella colwelliana]GIU44913.1 hypothetical protein TUM3794_34000 [Shewanella colwelliana]
MNFSHINWLDDNGYFKPPIMLYIMLAFIARGWCVFIASLTQASDRAGLVALIYPQKSDFLLALAAGAGALLLYGLVIAERKRKLVWLIPLFNQFRWLLVVLLLVDGGLLLQRLVHNYFLFNWSFGLDALFLFWSLLYIAKSKHLRYYLNDWRTESVTE